MMKVNHPEADRKSSTRRNFISALKSVFCPSRLLFLLVIILLFLYQLSGDTGQSGRARQPERNLVHDRVRHLYPLHPVVAGASGAGVAGALRE